MYFNVFGEKVSRKRYKEMLNAAKNRRELIAAGLTSRRDLMKLGLLTAGGMLVAKSGLSARAYGLNAGPECAGRVCRSASDHAGLGHRAVVIIESGSHDLSEHRRGRSSRGLSSSAGIEYRHVSVPAAQGLPYDPAIFHGPSVSRPARADPLGLQ